MARKLLERFRRRPDFAPPEGGRPPGAAPIRLANGQDWFLPVPMVEYMPVFRDGKAVELVPTLTLGDLDPLVEAIAEASDLPTRSTTVMMLGALLLLRHYDLTDDELGRLFVYRDGNPESETMLARIIEVATGLVETPSL